MRRKIAAGNWKMNKTPMEGQALVKDFLEILPAQHQDVVFCVPYVHLERISHAIKDAKNVFLGAQDCSIHEWGAHTGEVSVHMLAAVGTKFVLVGHSERREHQKETAEMLSQKVDLVLKANMTPVFCCGEPLAVRQNENQLSFVRKQLKLSLRHLSGEAALRIVVAYEPIWAIGTGLTATPEQAQDMHLNIRKLLATLWGKRIANRIPILYGGSVSVESAEALFKQPDVDGGLVGGASLKAADFAAIVKALPE